MSETNLIHCEFSSNSNCPPASHFDPRLIYVLSGDIRLRVMDQEYLLCSGDFILINSGQKSGWTGTGNPLVGMIVLHYHPLTELFHGTPLFFDCLSQDTDPKLSDCVRRLIRCIFTSHYSNDGQGKLLYYSSACQLLSLLVREFPARKTDRMWNFPKNGPAKRSYEILQYMSSNYMQPITLQSAADYFHLTPPYLSRFFKEQLNTNFSSYLSDIRLEHALNDILHSEKTMTRIAYDNGFPNSASFIGKFREVYQCTPSEYRHRFSSGKKKTEPDTGFPKEGTMTADIHKTVLNSLKALAAPENELADSERKELAVDCETASAGNKKHMKKPWQKLLHIGNSQNLLRYDIREQVKSLKDELGFEYVYLNNLFSEDMKIQIGSGSYNFSEIRKALDFIISLGMHPYIEIEAQENAVIKKMGDSAFKTSVRSRLLLLSENRELLDGFLQFLLRHYGADELKKWYICIERSTALNNEISEPEYFRHFAYVAGQYKKRIPGIQIGGPGFTVDFSEKRLEAFLQAWKSSGGTPDFINLYVFPYILQSEKSSRVRNAVSDNRHFLAHALISLSHVLNRLDWAEKETHVTIWNSTLSARNVLNDGSYKAACIMENFIDSWEHCDFLGYWNITDLAQIDEDVQKPLFGGCGLFTQSGLKKPAFHAVQFLNHLLPCCLSQTEHSILTWDGLGRYTICCHNYKHFSYLYYQSGEETVRIEEQAAMFEDNNPLELSFRLCNLPEGEYLIRKRFVSQNAGNIQTSWTELGKLEEFHSYEMKYLNSRTEPGLLYRREKAVNGTLVMTERLEAQEIVLLEIERNDH